MIVHAPTPYGEKTTLWCDRCGFHGRWLLELVAEHPALSRPDRKRVCEGCIRRLLDMDQAVGTLIRR